VKRLTAALLLMLLSARLLLAAAPPFAPPAPGVAPGETQHPDRAECALRLLQVGDVIQQYVLANDGRLPARLSEAFEGQVPQVGGALICPAMRPRVMGEHFRPSYHYIAPNGRTLAEIRGEILAFDAEPVHENGRNLLVSDADSGGRLQVIYLAEDAFQKQLAEQRTRTEQRGGEFHIIEDDLIPLKGLDPSAPTPQTGGDLFASTHFRVVVGLLAGIVIVLVALMLLRSRDADAGEPNG